MKKHYFSCHWCDIQNASVKKVTCENTVLVGPRAEPRDIVRHSILCPDCEKQWRDNFKIPDDAPTSKIYTVIYDDGVCGSEATEFEDYNKAFDEYLLGHPRTYLIEGRILGGRVTTYNKNGEEVSSEKRVTTPCGSCGERGLVLKNAKGRKFPYKSHKSVELKYDLEALTCNNCNEVILRPGDLKKLIELLERSLEEDEDRHQ